MREMLFFFGLVLAIFALLVLVWALRGCKKRGLGAGETVSLDDLALFSERLKLLGRPDRIKTGEFSYPRRVEAIRKADLSGP